MSGQAKSLDWLPSQKLESPPDAKWTFGRMALEILFFRSLFRNTKAEMKEGPKIVYGGTKWLWLFALAFHWAFLVVLLRHLRFFTDPVSWLPATLDSVDGFFRFTLPAFYATDAVLFLALVFLLARRYLNPQVRYISLAADYFPLYLLLAVAATGMLMRYVAKTDVVAVKEARRVLPDRSRRARGALLPARPARVDARRLFPVQQAHAPRRGVPLPDAEPRERQPAGPAREPVEPRGGAPLLRPLEGGVRGGDRRGRLRAEGVGT